MDKIKVLIKKVNIGKFDTDSIEIEINGNKTEICFDKSVKVLQHEGKEVYLEKNNSIYTISTVNNIEPSSYVRKRKISDTMEE